jgi:hypothetical protein
MAIFLSFFVVPQLSQRKRVYKSDSACTYGVKLDEKMHKLTKVTVHTQT